MDDRRFIWCYYELWRGLDQAPFPSPADAAFLLFPVGAAAALVMFPTTQNGQSRIRLILDGIIVAGSLFVISWVSLLGSVYRAGGDSHFAFDVSLAYPIADLVTVTMTIVVLARAHTTPSGCWAPGSWRWHSPIAPSFTSR